MARTLLGLVHRIGSFAAREGLAHVADAELLRRFVEEHDPVAFEVLVWRHGAMVRETCGRRLGRDADADDAFQATFLALVRHAGSVRCGASLAGWLYRVARHVSLRISRQRAQRRRRERRVARAEAIMVNDAERFDWREVLDREIERLPTSYREAFILCHLEGRAHEDAARELGCPLGTLHSRLARAKDQLRTRLQRRGVALPAVAAGVVCTRLVHATVGTAVGLFNGSVVAAPPVVVALSEGVRSTMALVNAKWVAVAVLSVATLGSGTVLLSYPPVAACPAPTEPTLEELKRENERLRREVANLKGQLEQLQSQGNAAQGRDDDPPADAEVLRALARATRSGGDTKRDDVIITKERILDRLGPPRFFPLVGLARVRHQHWMCTVHFTEVVTSEIAFPVQLKRKRVEVVYVDKDSLAPAADWVK
jgi:RNA polymerase sigma factor (sigma-70 family)